MSVGIFNKKYKIIDFHTHPFNSDKTNICIYKDNCKITADTTQTFLNNLGVQHICGSVVCLNNGGEVCWDNVRELNDLALQLSEYYKGFYVPGFHVHPKFKKQSIFSSQEISPKVSK
jgi:hypothetical protein